MNVWHDEIKNKLWQVIDKFDHTFNQLVDWVDEHGEIPSDKSYLGKWCKQKKYSYRYNTLSDERIKLLETVPGWSWELTVSANCIYYDGNKIDTIIDSNGNLWFNVKDVLLALEYKNYRDVVAKKIYRDYIKNKKELINGYLNGHPRSLYTNEIGMYQIIFTCKNKKAEVLKNWFFDKIYPYLHDNVYQIYSNI